MGFLSLVVLALVIMVLVLLSRVSGLERRLEEFEKVLSVLKRGNTARAPTPVPVPEVAPVRGQPAAVRVDEPAVVPQATVSPAPARAWNPPPDPESPSLSDKLIGVIRAYFTGGNLVVRVGVIVLFFGVAFLLKYAAEHTQLSIQMRLSAVAVGAVGLFAVGWWLRERRRGFSLALQGGSIGVLYLTLFAALRLYALLSAEMAFAMMAALGVISCLLAVRQDALALSMLGATGGFLAPVLASTGQGSHVVLFGYYALLDAFIVAQAWFKAWRPLNLLAFVFTFGVGTAWGVMRYEPAQFATTEPFLLFFFLAFIAIAVLFAFRAAPKLTHYVDGTLVFGTPVVAMALQMELVRDHHHGRAWSALGAGVIYLIMAAWLHHFQRDTLRLLKESFLALGVAFLTLAVPLWFDDTWTSTTWALEGAALVWMAVRQNRALPLASGMLLQLAAAAAYALRDDVSVARYPVANADVMGAWFISVAGLIIAAVVFRPYALVKHFGPGLSALFLAWGLGWWLYAGGNEIQRFVPESWDSGAYLGLVAVTALACGASVRRLAWPMLRVPALLLLPAMMAAAAWWSTLHLHPSSEGGWLAWPVAFVALWLCIGWNEASLPQRVAGVVHGFAVWLLVLLLSWELSWQVGQIAEPGTVWADAAWYLVPTMMLAVLASRLVGRWWPLRNHQHAFSQWVACGLSVFLLLWTGWLNFSSDGNAMPWPYLPLVNPLDVAAGLALLVVARWTAMVWHADEELFTRDEQRLMIAALVVAVFVWLNAILLRTMHYWTGVAYEPGALAADTAVQAALSIFWTLLALGSMLWANRSGQRVVWFCAAVLMAVVVVKLFLVDLVHVGTLARIVSFLVVGGLMLVIGYFSPLPPATKFEDQANAKG